MCLCRTRPKVLASVPQLQAENEGLGASLRTEKGVLIREGDRFKNGLKLLREAFKRCLFPELGLENFQTFLESGGHSRQHRGIIQSTLSSRPKLGVQTLELASTNWGGLGQVVDPFWASVPLAMKSGGDNSTLQGCHDNEKNYQLWKSPARWKSPATHPNKCCAPALLASSTQNESDALFHFSRV